MHGIPGDAPQVSGVGVTESETTTRALQGKISSVVILWLISRDYLLFLLLW